MKTLRTNPLRSLGDLFGLGLSFALIGCGNGASNTSAGAGSTTTASGSGGGASTGGSGSSSGGGGSGGSSHVPELSFFVTSDKSATGNLGGLAAADQRCQDLAAAAGAGSKTWRAYLSVEQGVGGQPEHAKDRIGTGPWYNANLEMVAADLDALHARFGDHTVFLDEKGEMVPGQWPSSPTPNEHDILTGTNRDGTVATGKTCADWTSEDAAMAAVVGHSDGLGPMGSSDAMYRPWNSVHDNQSCADTAPRGGAGRIYCFAAE